MEGTASSHLHVECRALGLFFLISGWLRVKMCSAELVLAFADADSDEALPLPAVLRRLCPRELLQNTLAIALPTCAGCAMKRPAADFGRSRARQSRLQFSDWKHISHRFLGRSAAETCVWFCGDCRKSFKRERDPHMPS